MTNDLRLIHTQGLDEGIRCAMCTNTMKSDKGCDGGCVVDQKMYEKVLKVIDKALEQQPYDEDFIHHKKEVLERIDRREREIDKYIKELEELEQQPSEDTDEEIDKAQAVEQAYVDKMVELAVEEVKRPKGKWIRVVDKAGHWVWECEDCKWQQRIATNFCPDCGAEMSGGRR